jgi:hypothetical protein
MIRSLLRLIVLLALCASPCRLAAADVIDPATAREDGGTLWYDVRPLGVEGQGWADKDLKAPFDRLPKKAEEVVRPPVWNLSRHSAGLCVRFVTDAQTIQGRWTLTGKELALPHMPATGVSGLDLYVRVGGRWQWLGVGRPTAPTNTATLANGLAAGPHELLLYLPLYNGVSSVEIGLPKGAKLWRAEERPAPRRKPILFYGTSITQGGCASRPGMVHNAILGRKLDRPVLNLGFSGNGKMEPALARLFAELDPAVYVLDCLPNMNAKEIEERVEPFVRTLRQARPDTPILLVEDRSYANSSVVASAKKHNEESRAALARAFDALQKSGVKGVHYLKGDKLLAADGEDTVDGSHPTDLGFLRQAEAMLPALTPLLP